MQKIHRGFKKSAGIRTTGTCPSRTFLKFYVQRCLFYSHSSKVLRLIFNCWRDSLNRLTQIDLELRGSEKIVEILKRNKNPAVSLKSQKVCDSFRPCRTKKAKKIIARNLKHSSNRLRICSRKLIRSKVDLLNFVHFFFFSIRKQFLIF